MAISRPQGKHVALAGVTYDDTARIDALVADGWRIEKVVSDVDKRRAAVILRKS